MRGGLLAPVQLLHGELRRVHNLHQKKEAAEGNGILNRLGPVTFHPGRWSQLGHLGYAGIPSSQATTAHPQALYPGLN